MVVSLQHPVIDPPLNPLMVDAEDLTGVPFGVPAIPNTPREFEPLHSHHYRIDGTVQPSGYLSWAVSSGIPDQYLILPINPVTAVASLAYTHSGYLPRYSIFCNP